MTRRLSAILLTCAVLIFLHNTVLACNEEQTNTYVTQILFGAQAPRYQSDEKVKMLLQALYLCSEQSDEAGQDKLNYLNQHKVLGLPSLAQINIKGDELLDCSHIRWEDVYLFNQKTQENRKQVLTYTVNTVFDFGFFKELCGNISEENNSFSALLYYFHILADYLADDPQNTENYIDDQYIPPYAGDLCIPINGDNPSFTQDEKNDTNLSIINSLPDIYGRPQTATVTIGKATEASPRTSLYGISPPGWAQNKFYINILNPGNLPLYDRCHLIARSFGGPNKGNNLVSCTRYLNQVGMVFYEKKISSSIEKGLHVKYKVTPHYKGENKIVSGIQMEAYSIEDAGKEINFNVYCYNVQPGIYINYLTGANELSDITFEQNNIIPFAIVNPNDNNPDLIYEVNKHLEILFANQKELKGIYDLMMHSISEVANDARKISTEIGNQANIYREMKKCEYEYLEILKIYIPQLFLKTSIFTKAFNMN